MSHNKSYAFMQWVFPLLERVSTWKSFYAALLRFSAVGVGFVASVFCIHNFRKVPNLSLSGDMAVFAFNFGVCITAYMVIHLFWHRSHGIKYLDEESYPVLRIFSHIARLAGEIAAALCFGAGLSAGFAICIAGREAILVTYGVGFFEIGSSAIFWGLTTMIVGIGYGVLSLLCGRMCFEGMILMIDVSSNIRRIKLLMQTKQVMNPEPDHERHVEKKNAA